MSEDTLSATATAVFAEFRQAAEAGERAPTLQQLQRKVRGDIGRAVKELASGGFIRSYVYVRNWRVIEIARGVSEGRSTAPPPRPGKPYAVLAVGGYRHLT